MTPLSHSKMRSSDSIASSGRLYYGRSSAPFRLPMPIIILIPTVICIVALFRDSVQRAFINVYLPIFMLFPVYYFWKVASLPPIDLSEAALAGRWAWPS